MTDSAEQDSNFYKTFKAVMDQFGMPCPSTLFGTFTTALGSISALVSGLKVAPTASLGMMYQALPRFVSQAVALTALAEICAVVGGLSAAAYVGICIGALIVATWDTYGPASIGKLTVAFRNWEKSLGKDVHRFMQDAMHANPMRAPHTMMLAIDRARGMSAPRGR